MQKEKQTYHRNKKVQHYTKAAMSTSEQSDHDEGLWISTFSVLNSWDYKGYVWHLPHGFKVE